MILLWLSLWEEITQVKRGVSFFNRNTWFEKRTLYKAVCEHSIQAPKKKDNFYNWLVKVQFITNISKSKKLRGKPAKKEIK